MDWKTYTEKELVQFFPALIEELESAAQQLKPGEQAYAAKRINLARQEWEEQSRQTPGRLFRPAALKLANIAKVIAENLHDLGLPADAANVANLSFEIYRSFQNDKYLDGLADALRLYAATAVAPASISLADARKSLDQIVRNLRPTMRDSVEMAALTGLADSFDMYLRHLRQPDRTAEAREFVSANLQAMVGLADSLGSREASVRLWREEGARLVPELMELLADQNVPGLTTVLQGNLPAEELTALRQAVQEVGYQRVFGLLEQYEANLLTSLLAVLEHEQSNIVEPPSTIRDPNPNVCAAFEAAVEQLSHDTGRAIRTLEEAYRLNPTNARVMEWLGTLYLRQKPSNLLRAREYLENLPPRWYSFTRDWNLSVIYRRLGGEERQRAFELLKESFLDEPRASTLKASLALALDLNHQEYLIQHLREVLQFEAAALGFVRAYKHKDRPSQDVYLIQLESYLADGVPTLPSLNLLLRESEIQNLKSLFIGRRLVDAGIVHFEDRYRRQGRSYQRTLLLEALLDLLEAAGRFGRALEHERHQFEFALDNVDMPEGKATARLQELLRYCRAHKLNEAGLDLLQMAPRRNITLTQDQRNYWRRVFGLEEEKHIPSTSADISPSGDTGGQLPAPEPLSSPSVPGSSEASNILLTSNLQLAKLRSVGSVLEHRALIEKCFWAVEVLIGPEARPVVDHLGQMLAALEEFQGQPDLNQRRGVAQRLLQMQRSVEQKQDGVRDRNIVEYLSGVENAIRMAVYDAASRVKTLPVLRPKILSTFLTSRNDTDTTLVVEIENESDLPVQAAEVHLRLGLGAFMCAPDDAMVKLATGIPVKGKRLVCFRLRRDPAVNSDRETILLSGTYVAEGMKGLPLFEDLESADVRIQPFKNIVGGEGKVRNPYIATGAVPFERPENFHGRGELLDRIRGSVADQESREALFINGIRRIGKTSIVNMLEGEPPPGLLPVKVRLDSMNPESTGLFLYAVAILIAQRVAQRSNLTPDFLNLQAAESLKLFEEHPQIAFPRFLDQIAAHVTPLKLFLMFDEFQIITEAIQRARAEGKAAQLDVNLLDMIRGYLEERRFLALFTGSLLFAEIRQHVPDYNRLWGSITPIDAGFVDADAVGQILRFPASRQQIVYTDAAIARAFEHTQGYPWFVQMIGTEIVGILNAEERLVVSSQDVDTAASELVGRDYNFDGYWWERERFEPRLDGPILRAILDSQPAEWTGLPVNGIVEASRREDLPPEAINQRIAKLRQFHILDRSPTGQYRIKALILERWLQIKRAENDGMLPFGAGETRRAAKKVAIMVDHENIWVGLAKLRDKASDRKAFMAQTSIEDLVLTFGDHAQKYGQIVARCAVADWHNPREVGPGRHQQAYRTAGFETPLPILRGQQVADHELRDRVHDLRVKHPEIDLYVLGLGDGDYAGMVEALLNDGKEVVLWSLRTSLHRFYEVLKDRRGLRIEYVEDILSLSEF